MIAELCRCGVPIRKRRTDAGNYNQGHYFFYLRLFFLRGCPFGKGESERGLMPKSEGCADGKTFFSPQFFVLSFQHSLAEYLNEDGLRLQSLRCTYGKTMMEIARLCFWVGGWRVIVSDHKEPCMCTVIVSTTSTGDAVKVDEFITPLRQGVVCGYDLCLVFASLLA